MISDADLALIRRSFLAAKNVRDFDRSPIFYQNFFRRAPEKKKLFREDLAGQGMRFMATMQAIIHALDAPSKLDQTLQPLAKGHAALGVAPKDFETMCEALIDTLRDVLGQDLTPEMENAWRNGFMAIGERMVELGKPK